ncbi:MAG: hypothetical protein WAU52_11140 [Burkholderiales bacterium]
MKIQNTTARRTLVALIASIGLAAVAIPSFADSQTDYPTMMGGYGPGYGAGPGMMGGPGYGRGYGPGYGGVQGATGGYGPGYGMGPWMMGGYGPGYGMGPGMMGGYGAGYGMGPWMMGGYGGYGMGPGMMGGYGGYGYNPLNLSDAQRTKIQKIQEDAARSQWEIMNKMHEAISQGWQDAQKKIDAVLTKEQREQLQRGWQGR